MALIPPLAFLDDYADKPGYYLYLAPMFRNETYDRFVWRTSTKLSYTILDNGAFEGDTVDDEALMELAIECAASELVVPDVLGDMAATLEKARDFKHLVKSVPNGPEHYMGVVQGRTVGDCIKCVRGLAELDYVTTIGLPKHLLETVRVDSVRIVLTDFIRQRYGDKFEIHFLGSSPVWPQELKSAARRGVRSMDTSMPWVYALREERLTDTMCSKDAKRPATYFWLTRSSFSEKLLQENIDVMKRWASGS